MTVNNVERVRRAGRCRWRIENETFNTLKNQGYRFEHNYGHGDQYLSVVLALLMMLAFLVDQTQQLCDPLFRAAWQKLGSKSLLWERLRGLFYAYRRSHPFSDVGVPKESYLSSQHFLGNLRSCPSVGLLS